MIQIALYKPEIAGNVGAIIRSCACFDVVLHIIEPCGFPFDMARVRKSALDYIEHTKIIRHSSFEEFFANEIEAKNQRLILATTKSNKDYRHFEFAQNDIVIFGQESSGVPDFVVKKTYDQIKIPMKNKMRSLNIAVSVGIILSKGSDPSLKGSDPLLLLDLMGD